MNRSVPAFLVLVLASASATAAEPEARGFFLGGMGGTTTLGDDGAFYGYDLDDSGTSYGIVGGYKFFRYLSVEGRLLNLGDYRVQGVGIDTASLSAHVVGIVPFGRSGWELFGQLGIGAVGYEVVGESDSATAGSAGIGLRF
ncbi:MAG: outer membrane beta-barrel protein, partial [Gammaproteobacteria bacterium]|nr:outer membrane beta-barrel protein [Gammaproteobacteria bacterium]